MPRSPLNTLEHAKITRRKRRSSLFYHLGKLSAIALRANRYHAVYSTAQKSARKHKEKPQILLLALNAANVSSSFPALVSNSQLDHHHVPSNGNRHEQ